MTTRTLYRDCKAVGSGGMGRKKGMHEDLSSIFYEKIEFTPRSRTIAP